MEPDPDMFGGAPTEAELSVDYVAFGYVLASRQPAWQAQAACAGVPVSSFFPRHGETADVWECEECPVRTECLDYAIEEGIEHGWWGGVSASRRRRMASERDAT